MAITSNDVETSLPSVIINSPLGDGSKAIQLTNGFVPVSTFVTLFQNSIDMTANSLLQIDGNKLGYSDIIKKWQTNGYIK